MMFSTQQCSDVPDYTSLKEELRTFSVVAPAGAERCFPVAWVQGL